MCIRDRYYNYAIHRAVTGPSFEKSFLEVKDNEGPHCTIEDLEKHNKGLILLTGSLDGLIGKLYFKNRKNEPQ